MFFISSFPSLPTLSLGILRVAAFQGFAPFAWREGSQARGRDIDFLGRFADAHGLELTVDFHDFHGLWELPARESADVAASGISLRCKASGAGVAWTRPYTKVRRTLLIRSEDFERIRGMHDLGRLAVVPHSAAQSHAEKTLPASAKLSFASTLESGIEDLLLGQVDAVGTGSASAEFHMGRHPGLAMVDVHATRGPEPIAFAIRPELAPALDAFIIKFGGTY